MAADDEAGVRAGDATTVTVVIPTRDRCGPAHEAVTTALRQDGVRVEVVVVDDGSTPPLRLDVRFGSDAVRVVHHQVALGPAEARNTGARFATGDWLAFLDDDDRWHPGKLAAQLRAVAATADARWCVSSARQVLPSGRLVGIERPPVVGFVDALRSANVVPGGGSGVLVRRDAFAAAGGFDASFRTLADWELWLRLATTIGLPAVADEPLVDYLLNPTGMLVGDALLWHEVDHLEQKHGPGTPTPVTVDRTRLERYLGYRRSLARRRNTGTTRDAEVHA